MTDVEEKKLLAILEATALTTALSELIMRVESETTLENSDLAKRTINYLRFLKNKYQKLSHCPLGIDSNGHIIPLIGEKDIRNYL